MRILLTAALSIAIALTACQTRQVVTKKVPILPVSVGGTQIPSTEYDGVRNAEVIKRYPIGRYIDPNNPRIMHERHTVNRQEQAPSWNLRPGDPLPVSLGPTYVANPPGDMKSAMAAELAATLQKQQGYNEAINAQNQALQAVIEELKTQNAEEKQRNEAIQGELKSTLDQMRTIRRQLQEQATPTPPPTPAPSPKEKSWWQKLSSFYKSPATAPARTSARQRVTVTPDMQAAFDVLNEQTQSLERFAAQETPQTPDADNILIDLDKPLAPTKP